MYSEKCLGSVTSKYFYTGTILMELKLIESVIWKREYFVITAVHFVRNEQR